MKRYAIATLFTLCSLFALGQDSQSAFTFLRLPMSAHSAALGGDNITIIEDDATLIFSNPAMLASVSDKTIALGYMNYMSGCNVASASFSRVVKKRASWAASAQYADYGKMKEVDENNVQTGEFSAKDIALTGYFSYMLTDKLVGGISAKFITSYIGSYNALGVGVDLGLNYYDPERNWSLSAVAKNLGGQVKAYHEDYDPMPIDIQLGASKQFAHVPLRVSATLVDLTHWNYRFVNHLALGAEFIFSPSIWIGGGYNFRRANEMKISTEADESAHGAGWSFGGGVNMERFKLNLAYSKYHVSSSSLIVNVAYSL